MSRLPFNSTTNNVSSNFSATTPDFSARIVGGAEVTPFEHPWVVLLYAGGYMCAGAARA